MIINKAINALKKGGKNMFGYRWYIKDGMGLYEPHEKTFNLLHDCVLDFLQSGYSIKYIGIDYVEDDEGYIEVIRKVIKPKETYYDEDL